MRDMESSLTVRSEVESQARERALEVLESSKADYLEIRLEERKVLALSFRGDELDDVSRSSSSGGFIRAMLGGSWGYASFTDFDRIPQMALKAERAAGIIGRGESRLVSVEAARDSISTARGEDPELVSMEEKVEIIGRYNDIMLKTEKVQTTSVSYGESSVTKTLLTNEGTDIRQESKDLNLMLVSIARDGDIIQMGLEMEHSPGDFGRFRDLDCKVQEIADRSVSLLQASPPCAGKFDVVTDPHLTGIFAHEAFGHLSEADFVSRNDNLRSIMQFDREFGNSNLNIIDDGSLTDLPGCFRYDDEGVRMGKTYLIREGRLAGRLHNRETAALMGEVPTGNARAVNFFHEPVVRMTCTYVDKGDWDPKEMIRDIDDGYYVRASKGGQTNLEQFTFSGEEAYRIENGELTDHVRDLNISGNLFETLKDIDAVGNDLLLRTGGFCGKGEHYPLPVSSGGPHMRIRNVVVGGG